MRKYTFAALLAATVATPALAQEAAPFTGLRVEGIVGYDRVGVEDLDDDQDGVTYGAGIGYDVQFGAGVAGVEAEITDSTVDECQSGVLVTGDELCAQVGRDIYVGGRIGTLVGANTLLYGKAGYTNARLQTEYDPVTGDNVEEGDNLDGVRLGAGLEHAIGPNSFVKAEYRYSNYESGFEKHQGVVGIGFRF
ncbi:MAG TPA: porin family protein [Allosphingosinicella sp.]|uniref:outer membrane protein n=1 Tax=Allosphingosinicella sp. TaxID=2823234 RepID=UPI002EDA042C